MLNIPFAILYMRINSIKLRCKAINILNCLLAHVFRDNSDKLKNRALLVQVGSGTNLDKNHDEISCPYLFRSNLAWPKNIFISFLKSYSVFARKVRNLSHNSQPRSVCSKKP